MPLVRRTRATLRSAEFGFLGVWVNTRTHTPRFCGLSCNAGLFVLVRTLSRPCRTSWLIVGTIAPRARWSDAHKTTAGHYQRARLAGGPDRLFGAPSLGTRASGPAPEADLPYKDDAAAPDRERGGGHTCHRAVPHLMS